MRTHESVFGECHDETGAFDIGRLAERLLLFERVILRSSRLSELPQLVEAFGVGRLTKLLNRGALVLDCEPYGIGNHELSPLQYRIASFRVVKSPKETTSAKRFYTEVRSKLPEMRRMQQLKLDNAVERSFITLPDDFLHSALVGLRKDVAANIPSLHTAALLALKEVTGKDIASEDLQLRFHPAADDNYVAETNLIRLGVPEEQAHVIGRKALFAIVNTEAKLDTMRTFNAICDFRESELAILNEKANHSWEESNAGVDADRLARVLRLKGFPDFSAAARLGQIDYPKLLDARESDACEQFRAWLRSIDAHTDEELQEQMNSMLPAIAAVVGSRLFKIVKFALSQISFGVPIPDVVSGAASAVAEHVGEKRLASVQPLAFLDDAVGSILRDKT